MSDFALRCDALSKRFTLGNQATYGRLSETIAGWGGRLLGRRDAVAGRELWALRDVSFEVRRGEVVGVVGRNGAGKSTLLKILSRITPPTSGFADVRGRVGSLLEVGTGFHPELTGRENVYLNGAILGMSRTEIRRKFDEIIAFAEVESFLDTPVKRYSSGMTVRLAFAVAAHLEPEVLIVDEVLSVGDTAFQKKCLGKVGEVSRHGRTVLIVSHNLPSIVNLCDRALLLEAGRVAHSGPAGEVVREYLSRQQTTGGEVIWDSPEVAPGTAGVRLHRVRILQPESTASTSDIESARETIVEIHYWVLDPEQSFFAALWLRDTQGNDVLASAAAPGFATAHPPGYGRKNAAGLYMARCWLPPNFLNDRSYRVTAVVNQVPWTTQVLLQDLVEFRVHDTSPMRQGYTGEWFGSVRPVLDWEVEYVGTVDKQSDQRDPVTESTLNAE